MADVLPASSPDTDRNLLFGVLALQGAFLDSNQFAEACAAWALRKGTPLAELLIERGWLTPEERQEVERLVQRHVKRHSGDVRQSLGAVAGSSVRDLVRDTGDAEICRTLTGLTPAAGHVLVETLKQSPEPPAQGRWRYSLTRLHAEGGLGRVYIARDNDLGRDVALKEMKPDQACQAEAGRRFLKEAQVTGQLEHPNIVPVYELGRRPGDDQPFYCMRLVRGQTLREAVAAYHQGQEQSKPGVLELRRLLSAFVDVCQAIGYAHSRGVIHRDLKPENVLLGSFGEVIVLDWGLAKLVDRPEEEDAPGVTLCPDSQAEMTQAGRQLGTPAYMAPEQAEGRIDLIDARTDIYGLGSILFEILTGRPPHMGPDTITVLRQIMHGETPRARAVAPRVPAALDAICAKALARSRAERYARALHLADDVHRWLADEPVAAYPESWTARAWRWVKHHRPLVASVAAAVVVAALSLAAATGLLARANQDLLTANLRESQATAVAEQARQAAEQDRLQAETARRASERFAATLLLERGLALCEEGDTGAGLLWLARGLEQTPADALDLQWAVRANLAGWRREVHALKRVLPQDAPVMAVAFSPDGLTLLTADARGMARLWDARTGEPRGVPMRHQNGIWAVAFSPDGQSVLSGSADQTARVWDAHTGQPRGEPLQQGGNVLSVAFSPNGRMILTAGTDKLARLWDAATGKARGNPLRHEGPVSTALFSPDGKTVLTAGWDGVAQRWDVTTGQAIGKPMRHRDKIAAAALSPDGRTVATASWDHTARLWDAASGKPRGSALQHQEKVWRVAFSPDGRTVGTASFDKTARLWDARSGAAQGSPLLHQDPVLAVAFSPDGKTLLTGSGDRTARLWDVATARPRGNPLLHQDAVWTVAFSPDGKSVLSGSFNLQEAGADKVARLWEIAPGEARPPLLPHPGQVLAVAFSPDGRTILAGSSDKTARLWNVADGQPRSKPLLHQDKVVAVAFSRDGRLIASGSVDKTVRLWDAVTGEPRGKPLRHQAEVSGVAFSPDSRTVLSCSWDRTACLWSTMDGKLLRRVRLPSQGIAVAFSPDGKTFLTGGGDDHRARLWDAATGKPAGQPLPHEDFVTTVAFSPDGKTLLTGSADRTARLWNAATSQPRGKVLLHPGYVRRVAFAPDGRTLATVSGHAVRLWDAETGQPLGPALRHDELVSSVAFSPDGQTAVTGTVGSARLWTLPPPLEGDASQVRLWAEALTGMVLKNDGTATELDVSRWRQRSEKD
ncbi:MAG TPA: protein kinase [Gemmataceae bacterium]|jgi:WD40 repeat protein|nr:protein kinase [Gemmataceae bacterium]